MMVLSVQEYPVVKGILDRSYSPNFIESSYACSSIRFTKAYFKILLELSKKTGREFRYGFDSCMWGWVNVPFLPLHRKNGFKGYSKRKYAIFVEVPEQELVFSEYNLFCDYVNEQKDYDGFILDNFFYQFFDHVQCSFWNIDPARIHLIVDIDCLEKGYSVEELYEGNKLNDVSYLFDERAYELMFA